MRTFLFDMLGQRYALMDIDDAVARLETLSRDRTLLAANARRQARDFALQYDWRHVVAAWHTLLTAEIPLLQARQQALAEAFPVTLYHPCPVADRVRMQPYPAESAELMAAPLEARSFDDCPSLPVTLPLARPPQARTRLTGLLSAASTWDLLAVLALCRIFPGIRVWSTLSLGLSGGHSGVGAPSVVQTQVVEAGSAQYQAALAATTLALDVAGFDQALPVQAALGRQVLTDYALALELCAYARQHLVDGHAPPVPEAGALTERSQVSSSLSLA